MSSFNKFDKLKELKAELDKGKITEDRFSELKRKILNDEDVKLVDDKPKVVKKPNPNYDKYKKHLVERDGKTHVALVDTLMAKIINGAFEKEYKESVDSILSGMQDDGYEIIDVKFNVYHDSSMGSFNYYKFNTLIIYK